MSLIYKALEKAQQEKVKDEPACVDMIREEPVAVVTSAPVPAFRLSAGLIISLAGVILCVAYFYFNPGVLTGLFEKQAPRPTSPVSADAQAPAAGKDVASAPAPDVTAADSVPAGISAAADIKISGIISDEKSSLVIISGKVLSEGDVVTSGVHIKKIYKDSVVIESGGKERVIRK